MQQLAVSDVMRVCPTAVVSENLRLRDAAEILVVNNFSLLIVEDATGALAGVVPESAVVRKLMVTASRNDAITDILSRHVESVRHDASLDSVLHLFRSSCHAVIPVVDDTCRVAGILCRQDVVRLLLSDSDDVQVLGDSPHPLGQRPHFMDRPRPYSRTNKPNPPDAVGDQLS